VQIKKASKNKGVQKAPWVQETQAQSVGQPKNKSQRQKILCGRENRRSVRWVDLSHMIVIKGPGSEGPTAWSSAAQHEAKVRAINLIAVRSHLNAIWRLRFKREINVQEKKGRSNGGDLNLAKKKTHGEAFFSGDLWLRRRRRRSPERPKPPPNFTKRISFSSFFHEEPKCANGFQRFLTENQKRREQSSKTKIQKHDSGQIETN
jgi:hypothetical protein